MHPRRGHHQGGPAGAGQRHLGRSGVGDGRGGGEGAGPGLRPVHQDGGAAPGPVRPVPARPAERPPRGAAPAPRPRRLHPHGRRGPAAGGHRPGPAGSVGAEADRRSAHRGGSRPTGRRGRGGPPSPDRTQGPDRPAGRRRSGPDRSPDQSRDGGEAAFGRHVRPGAGGCQIARRRIEVGGRDRPEGGGRVSRCPGPGPTGRA